MTTRPRHELRRHLYQDVRRGVFGGAAIATCFSAWATFLRITAGAAPFEHTGTAYGQTVGIYFAAFTIGGVLIALLWPLRRWAIGSMVLGFLFLLPVYSGFVLVDAEPAARFSSWNVWSTLIISAVGGSTLGLSVWWTERRQRG